MMGKDFSGKRRIVILLVVACLVLANVPAFSQATDAEIGAAQGKADARSNGWWFVSGLLLPGVGVILPWLFAPSVPSDNLIGKSEEYVEAYQKSYIHNVKAGNFWWSMGGFGTAIVVVGVIAVATIASVGSGVANSCGSSLGSSCANMGFSPGGLGLLSAF